MTDVITPPPIILSPESPEASTVLTPRIERDAVEVHQIVDLVSAQYRAATVQAAGLDSDALTAVSGDPLVAALSAHFAHLPDSTRQNASVAARAILAKAPADRYELGPLVTVNLAEPLGDQVLRIATSLGTITNLNALADRSGPILRSAGADRVEATGPGEAEPRSIVLTQKMQAGIFLDRIHCWDLTGVGLIHDNIGLLVTGIDPELIDPGNPAGSIQNATFGTCSGMGYFSKGDDWPRPFPQPGGQFLHYAEHRASTDWPRTYLTTLTLVQQNPLASDSLHGDLVEIDNALRGKLVDALKDLTTAGLAVLGAKLGLSAGLIGGPIGALIGAIIGALVGEVVGALLGWIESYTENWYFTPKTFTLGEPFFHAHDYDWPHHWVDVYSHSGHYSIDAHHYRRHVDNDGDAIW